MKRIAILGILTLVLSVLFAGGAFALQYQSKQVDNCDEYVTMRAGSSITAAEVCKVSVGEVVMAADYNSGFDYCCYNGHYGYIQKRCLNTEITPFSDGVFRIANCNEWVSLRPMPDTSVEARMEIPLDAVLDKIFYNDAREDWSEDGFAYVCYQGQCGFVKWRYLDCINPQ